MHNLPVHVFVTWCGSAVNGPEMDRPNRAASVRAQSERQEAMMSKTDMLFVNSSVVYVRPIPGGDTCPDQDVYIQDERVVRLLVLLQQLDEAAAGLGALPKPELSEIVSSAIRLCGFADPIEGARCDCRRFGSDQAGCDFDRHGCDRSSRSNVGESVMVCV
jgi:hypothetical protein